MILSFIRWILFFPVAVSVSAVVYPINTIGVQLFSRDGFVGLVGRVVVWSLAGGCSGFGFVWVGGKVAPKGHFLISVILAVIVVFFTGVIVMGWLSFGDSREHVPWMEMVISCIAGLTGAIAACYSLYERESDN
jgi:hypothetical protein